jgi:hypothetical protein
MQNLDIKTRKLLTIHGHKSPKSRHRSLECSEKTGRKRPEAVRRNLTYLLHGAKSFLRSYQSLQPVKKFPAFLCNPKALYRTHKCQPPVPILSQLHPVPTTPSNFLKIQLNIIIPSTSGFRPTELSVTIHRAS